MELKRFSKGLLMLAAPPVLIASLLPMFVGLAVAFQREDVATLSNLLWFFLAAFTMVLIEIGKNTVNEYFDYMSGTDRFVEEENLTPFSGGRRVLTTGALSKTEVVFIGICAFGIVILAGLVMALFKTFLIFWIGVLGVVISILYTLPPFKLCYRGFGELAVGIVYGPLILLGTYTLIAEQYSTLPVLLSLPLGFLISNVLVINEFPDYEADLKANKKNLVVILGKQRAVYLYNLLFLFAYVSFLPIVIYTESFLFLPGLLTIPIAIKASLNCKKNYDNTKLMVASNKMTIAIHTITGILMIIAAILN